MKQKFARFMYGRYGTDQFSRFLAFISVALILLSLFFDSYARTTLFVLALAVLIYTYFRTFSKNPEKRRQENLKYLKLSGPFSDWFKLRRDMFKQRKTYKFFKCPGCKAVLRVPKGKGKVRIVCKKCGNAFEKKT